MNYPLAQINLSALQHNLAIVRQHTAAKILAMVKANAYGHGLIAVAKALQSAEGLGVARLEEALALREAGIKQKIVVMTGFLNAEELESFIKHDLDAVVHSEFQLELLEKYRHPREGGDPVDVGLFDCFAISRKPTYFPLARERRGKIKIWLKLDCGMHRLGFLPAEAESAYQRLMQCELVQKPLTFLTHFPNADAKEDTLTQEQTQQFLQVVKFWEDEKSLSNSACILVNRATQDNWVRPGIMLYGASPFAHLSAQQFNLKPVMTLRSQLIAIRHFKKGSAIGYGGHWVCPEDMPVGVVAIGYGDGYPRHAKSGTPVLINGQQASLIGRVSMDTISIDLRSIENPAVDDEVILWGEGLSADVVAAHAETISYELFCRLTGRVKFQHI